MEKLSIELTAFVTTSDDLAMRSQAQQPLLAEALVASGVGRTYGAQFMARLEPFHGFYGWVSYTVWAEEMLAPQSSNRGAKQQSNATPDAPRAA